MYCIAPHPGCLSLRATAMVAVGRGCCCCHRWISLLMPETLLLPDASYQPATTKKSDGIIGCQKHPDTLVVVVVAPFVVATHVLLVCFDTVTTPVFACSLMHRQCIPTG